MRLASTLILTKCRKFWNNQFLDCIDKHAPLPFKDEKNREQEVLLDYIRVSTKNA